MKRECEQTRGKENKTEQQKTKEYTESHKYGSQKTKVRKERPTRKCRQHIHKNTRKIKGVRQ